MAGMDWKAADCRFDLRVNPCGDSPEGIVIVDRMFYTKVKSNWTSHVKLTLDFGAAYCSPSKIDLPLLLVQ